MTPNHANSTQSSKKYPSNDKPHVQVNYILGIFKKMLAQTQRQAAEVPCLAGGPVHNTGS